MVATPGRRFSGLWRHREFRWFWAAQSVSLVGSGLGALPFTAIFALDARPIEMAFLAAAGVAPSLLFGLHAGVWVDRLRRRPLLIAADLGRATALGSIPFAWWIDALTMEHLYTVALVNGLLGMVFDVAYLSYVPALVERDQLVEANSKLAASASVAEFGSFSLGGFIVQVASAIWAAAADALSFLVSALCLSRIRRAEPHAVTPEAREPILHELSEGLSEVAHHPLQRALAVASLSRDLSYGVIGAVIILYGTRTLHLEPGVLGLVFGVGGATSLIGAMFAGRVTRRLGAGPATATAMLVAALGGLLIVAAGGSAWVAAAFLVASQFVIDPATTVSDVNETSLRQAITPARLLGRVNASVRVLGTAMLLAGSLAGGVLGETVGLRAAIAVGLAPRVLGALWLFASPLRRVRELPEAQPTAR